MTPASVSFLYPDTNKPVFLLTGFQEPLGRRMVDRLLGDHPGAFFYLLVQQKHLESARRYASTIAARHQPEGDDSVARLRCLPGILTQENLGLDRSIYRILLDSVTRVFHFSGVHTHSQSPDVAYKVNVIGTRRLLDFCRQARTVTQVACLSTVLVSGLRRGLVLEHELDENQHFRSFYESTRFKAEVEIRKAMEALPITVFRMGLLVGDSRTGVTESFDGLYPLIRFFKRVKDRLGDGTLRMISRLHANIGDSDARLPLIPIDQAIDAMNHILHDGRSAGMTVHLVPHPAPSAREVYRALCEHTQLQPPRNPAPARWARRFYALPGINRLTGIPEEVFEWFHHPGVYDDRNARRLLTDGGPSLPDWRSYFDRIVDYALIYADSGGESAA